MAEKEFELREQDRWLPIANVARLMKHTLPGTAKVSKDAKECMQECVSEFISFITSEASDKCVMEKRKTINGEDILYSMNSLGFENYSEVLKIYLAKYREQQALRQERGEIKKKKIPSAGPEGEEEEDYMKFSTINDKQQHQPQQGGQQQQQTEQPAQGTSEQEYVQQLYEQDYGGAHYSHNPDYHNYHQSPPQQDPVTAIEGTPQMQDQQTQQVDESADSGADATTTTQGIDSTNTTTKTPATTEETNLSLNLTHNVNTVVSETEELAGLANGHHGENVLYRYQ
ncbi:unnamed protein product [Ambrosiozyma monospora]|uniref:Unnamed protein product n=1 Tax=Ambrosiozyma monospora TaxID=43982 RepID=A0A9W7DCA0_AMBMO|nr:unnamed protein product [Ambrosiozyma monospora]